MATVSSKLSKGPWRPPAIALLVYPLTLLVGSLYSVISPTAHQHFKHLDPLAPAIPSEVDRASIRSPAPVNYFARKDNVFNLYFVKVGWVWTTLAFVSLLLTQPTYRNRYSFLDHHRQCWWRLWRRISQAVLRYTIVTLSWILTTQWFFGPAIIDRMFTLSGGKCESRSLSHLDELSQTISTELKAALTATACKAAGGAWRGGHDVSGHVFMLVLASAFLVFETLGASTPGLEIVVENGPRGKENDTGTIGQQSDLLGHSLRVWSLRFVWAVALLNWWMLLMTAIWFHTWLEKVSGLLIAFGAIYITYLLPGIFLPWRDFIGAPGV